MLGGQEAVGGALEGLPGVGEAAGEAEAADQDAAGDELVDEGEGGGGRQLRGRVDRGGGGRRGEAAERVEGRDRGVEGRAAAQAAGGEAGRGGGGEAPAVAAASEGGVRLPERVGAVFRALREGAE